MKTLKTILLTLAILLMIVVLIFCTIVIIHWVAKYATLIALLIPITMLGLCISTIYKVADMIISEREDKKE